MGKVKTGALIVVEDSIKLDEYVRTGIDVDGFGIAIPHTDISHVNKAGIAIATAIQLPAVMQARKIISRISVMRSCLVIITLITT